MEKKKIETVGLNEFANRLNVSEYKILLAINENKITSFRLENGVYELIFEAAKTELINNVLIPEKTELKKVLQKEIDEMPSIKIMSLTLGGIPNELLEGLSYETANKISKKLYELKKKIYDAANIYEEARKSLPGQYNFALSEFGLLLKE